MGNYISKVTPVRPVFGKKLDESNIIVGEEILETPNQSDLNEEQAPNNSKDSLKVDEQDSQSQDNGEVPADQATHHTNGNHTNGSHTNGFTNGQSNGHSSSNNHTNGHSISKDNGEQNGAEEEAHEEDELNGEQQSNGKLSKSDLKNKKADKQQYSSKKSSLINEVVDPVEPQPDEEELDNFEVVGRKRKGRKSATPKKQYKKRKNNLLSDLEKVNELAVDE